MLRVANVMLVIACASVLADEPRLTFSSAPRVVTTPLQITMYTDRKTFGPRWCVYCSRLEADSKTWKSLRLKVSDDPCPSAIQQEICMLGRTVRYPVLAWPDASGTTRFYCGYETESLLLDRVLRNDPPLNLLPPQHGPGGTLNAVAIVQEILSQWEQHIGQDKPVSVSVDQPTSILTFPLFDETIGWFQSQINLSFGKTLAFTTVFHGGALLVSFSGDMPQVNVESWFEFDLPVKSLLISADNIHVEFDSRLIRSRDIAISATVSD